MATVTVTNDTIFSNGDVVTASDLTALGIPTVTVTGIATADIQAGAITTPLIAVDAIEDILDAIYPVGSIYISIIDAHPDVGNWTRVSEGTVLVGYKQSDPDFNNVTGNQDGGNKTINVADHDHSISTTTVQSGEDDVAVESINPDGGFTENIMNPYTVVYMFRRTL
jgi:hypothetical protein